jgi:cell division protein FtsB
VARQRALMSEQAALEEQVQAAGAAHDAAEQKVRVLRPELAPAELHDAAVERAALVTEKLAREDLGYLAADEMAISVPAVPVPVPAPVPAAGEQP